MVIKVFHLLYYSKMEGRSRLKYYHPDNEEYGKWDCKKRVSERVAWGRVNGGGCGFVKLLTVYSISWW